MRISILLLCISIGFVSCLQKSNKALVEISPAERVLEACVEAHGGDAYETAQYEFVFRKNKYQFYHLGDRYTYFSESIKKGQKIEDRLDNTGFSRKIDGVSVALSSNDSLRYMGGINSVIYFATLPYKLQDQAVFKEYKGTTKIKNVLYDVIQVSFAEDGGGQDHDDVFYYWINSDTKLIDFLAYNYSVNKGGVRFRQAYNSRRVDGIVFQDYINYKAKVGTSLASLPDLWSNGELKELSRIETEGVRVLID